MERCQLENDLQLYSSEYGTVTYIVKYCKHDEHITNIRATRLCMNDIK